jgi:hypothetical protein
MPNSPVVTLRLSELVLERVDEQVAKASDAIGKPVSRSAWITEAIIIALEKEEAPHMPKAIRAAIPTRRGNRMIMPEGVQSTRY